MELDERHLPKIEKIFLETDPSQIIVKRRKSTLEPDNTEYQLTSEGFQFSLGKSGANETLGYGYNYHLRVNLNGLSVIGHLQLRGSEKALNIANLYERVNQRMTDWESAEGELKKIRVIEASERLEKLLSSD